MASPETSKERQLARRVLKQLQEKGLLDRQLVAALLAESVEWLLNHDPSVREQLQELLRRYREEPEDDELGPVN